VVAAPLEATEVCRPGRVPLKRRELTAFECATARWARFVVGLCTTTGGSSLEPVLVDDVPPAVCAKLSAL
jgi:hypothetical protein